MAEGIRNLLSVKYRVELATYSRQALDMVYSQGDLSLILLDRGLPDGDGILVLSTLRLTKVSQAYGWPCNWERLVISPKPSHRKNFVGPLMHCWRVRTGCLMIYTGNWVTSRIPRKTTMA